MMDVLEYLNDIRIDYDLYEHDAVFTVDEAKALTSNIPGVHCKNLFLRNKKGTQHYLVVLEEDKDIDLKELSKKINSTNLSFASKERLKKYLKLEPGSVGPFGLINDEENHVRVILDETVIRSERVSFHPNRNTATVSIMTTDLMKYFSAQKYIVEVLK